MAHRMSVKVHAAKAATLTVNFHVLLAAGGVSDGQKIKRSVCES